MKAQKAGSPEDCERWEESETSPTLDAAGHAPRTATAVVAFTQNQREELRDLEGVATSLSSQPGTHQDTYIAEAPPIVAPALTESWKNNGGTGGFDGRDEAVLAITESTSSAEASPARTSPSPGDAEASPGSGADSSSSSPESLSLFDPDGFSSRTYPVSSLATAVGTSASCLERWPSSGTAWLGGLSTHASSECRSDADGCSSSEPSLTAILEPPQNVPPKYSLSGRAARGILRRAQKRGRTLPEHLLRALESVADTPEP